MLECIAEWQPGRIARHEARFSAPVYPRDNLQVALWRDGEEVSFEASIPERGVTAVSCGKTLLR